MNSDTPKPCGRCQEPATHRPCCSSHGHHLCCTCYRRTHFVEVGPCCGLRMEARPLGEALERMEREDPEVGAARNSYDRMVDSILGRGPSTSSEDIRRIYGTPGAPD